MGKPPAPWTMQSQIHLAPRVARRGLSHFESSSWMGCGGEISADVQVGNPRYLGAAPIYRIARGLSPGCRGSGTIVVRTVQTSERRWDGRRNLCSVCSRIAHDPSQTIQGRRRLLRTTGIRDVGSDAHSRVPSAANIRENLSLHGRQSSCFCTYVPDYGRAEIHF